MGDGVNIDWDGIAQEADDTPRSLLAEALAGADEWTIIVLVVVDKQNVLHRWSIGTDPEVLGMLDMAHYYTMKGVAGD